MKAQVPVNQIVSSMALDVEITGLRTWRWRIALGTLLIRLGAWIIGMKVNIDVC